MSIVLYVGGSKDGDMSGVLDGECQRISSEAVFLKSQESHFAWTGQQNSTQDLASADMNDAKDQRTWRDFLS